MKKLMMLAGTLLLALILPGSVLAAPAEKLYFKQETTSTWLITLN